MSNTDNSPEASLFSDACDPPLVSAREVTSGSMFLIDVGLLVAWVWVTDWLLYQIGTYLTWGMLLILAVVMLACIKLRGTNFRSSAWIALAILMMAAKLMWGGSLLQIGCGLCLLLCYAMALAGCAPYLPEAMFFIGYICMGAWARIRSYRISTTDRADIAVKQAVSVILPSIVVACFATLFVLANPDLTTLVARQFTLAFDALGDFFNGFQIGESILWFVSGLVLLGLLYPANAWLYEEKKPAELEQSRSISPIYTAFRNTLLSVIVLFAVYLTFEFATLWFREFPENFYYAGYAHQGAFWLTVALALATLVLSAIFRGRLLADSRLAQLKRLAIIWSLENLLLSLAVYNRLLIYIDFNGMTRMRVVGLLGITAVVVGFGLVVIKLYRDRGFVWLLHRQLWVPALAIFAYAILPVDWLVNRYNVAQVQGGNSAPAVQIVAHRVTAEGMLPLVALVDCEDQKIREGVRAMLAMWADDLKNAGATSYMKNYAGVYRGNWQSTYNHRTPWLTVDAVFSRTDRVTAKSWQSFQLSTYLLQSKLASLEIKLAPYIEDAKGRDAAIDAFFEYAYQWY